jgi:hypothetical protein
MPPVEVAQHGHLADTEAIQQRRCVGGQQLEAVVDVGLGRLAPADLIGHDHPVSGSGQRLDDVAEVVTAECLAVHQHDRLPVRLGARRDIHICHRDLLQVIGKRQEPDRVGVLVVLEADAQSGQRFRRRAGHDRAPSGRF